MSIFSQIPYGNDIVNQFIRIYEPKILSNSNKHIVAIIHGGFWMGEYNIDNSLIDTLIDYLTSRNYSVCMIEYRRVGNLGGDGGYPYTNDDIINALNKLNEISLTTEHMDITKTIILGHSAGGHLAMWSCCNNPSKLLNFIPILCLALAPVGDLEDGYKRKLSDSGEAIPNYMGKISPTGLDGCPYLLASPTRLLPLITPTLLVAGRDDDCIPLDYIENIFSIATSIEGNNFPLPQLLIVDDAEHFKIVNSTTTAWFTIFNKMEEMINI
jgi:acetyl esterase/lipase